MRKKDYLSIFALIGCIFCLHYELHAQQMANSPDSLSTTDKRIYFTIRLGQGGFKDGRSPLGKLGGGQLTLDVKPGRYPFAVSISGEYYTNSADPTHPYEISGLTVLNLLYMTNAFISERFNIFAGAGAGRLEVPQGEDRPDEMETGLCYNVETGFNIRAFWKIGLYGIYKYLYAKKEKNSVNIIDFNEHIILLGITLNFCI